MSYSKSNEQYWKRKEKDKKSIYRLQKNEKLMDMFHEVVELAFPQTKTTYTYYSPARKY